MHQRRRWAKIQCTGLYIYREFCIQIPALTIHRIFKVEERARCKWWSVSSPIDSEWGLPEVFFAVFPLKRENDGFSCVVCGETRKTKNYRKAPSRTLRHTLQLRKVRILALLERIGWAESTVIVQRGKENIILPKIDCKGWVGGKSSVAYLAKSVAYCFTVAIWARSTYSFAAKSWKLSHSRRLCPSSEGLSREMPQAAPT